jgi:hypothetical protein
VLAGALVLLAGCGGDQSGARDVTGTGYRFRAPSGWELTRSVRAVRASEGSGSSALVGVSRFPLRRVYRPALWAQAVRELDGASNAIARRQHGSVTHAADLTISDERARRYTVTYELRGKKLVEELVFVLRAKTEYLLLCRYELRASHRACEMLKSSFKLT